MLASGMPSPADASTPPQQHAPAEVKRGRRGDFSYRACTLRTGKDQRRRAAPPQYHGGTKTMEKMKLIQRLIEREWTLFDKVRNIGGRASCQDDRKTFFIMRGKGRVRPCQQFTAERADERSTNSMNIARSEERRVGKECLFRCRSRWSPYH